MTPLQFEGRYAAQWRELETALDAIDAGKKKNKKPVPVDAKAAPDAARIAHLYRAACEHLALARARDYPVHLVEQLEQLTQRAHQAVYHRAARGGLGRLARLFLVGMPQAVRAHGGYVLAATLLFVLPLVGVGLATWADPGFALMLHDARTLQNYERMYGNDAESFGRMRSAGNDIEMFGFYVYNNIGIAFRTFASGLVFGVGSIFVLLFNGAWAGAIAGFLATRGLSHNFFSFVITHGAFELTAIVLAGAAGLALGHSLIAPGRRSRAAALAEAARRVVPVLYAVFALLMVAALVEAFWSSARWVPHEVKYGVGAACWALVLGWLVWQGRARKVRDAG